MTRISSDNKKEKKKPTDKTVRNNGLVSMIQHRLSINASILDRSSLDLTHFLSRQGSWDTQTQSNLDRRKRDVKEIRDLLEVVFGRFCSSVCFRGVWSCFVLEIQKDYWIPWFQSFLSSLHLWLPSYHDSPQDCSWYPSNTSLPAFVVSCCFIGVLLCFCIWVVVNL